MDDQNPALKRQRGEEQKNPSDANGISANVNPVKSEIDGLKARLNKLQLKYNTAKVISRRNRILMNTKNQRAESMRAEFRVETQKKEAEIQRLNGVINSAEKNIAQKQAELESLRANSHDLNEAGQLNSKIEAMERQLQLHQEEKTKLEEKIQEYQAKMELEEVQIQQQQQQKEQEQEQLQQQTQQLQQQQQELQQQQQEFRQQQQLQQQQQQQLQQQQQPGGIPQVDQVLEGAVVRDLEGETKYAAALFIYQPGGLNVETADRASDADVLRAKIAATKKLMRYAEEARKGRDIGKRERWRTIYPDMEVYLKIIERELSEMKGRFVRN
jgi:chromosome segregation ATPase